MTGGRNWGLRADWVLEYENLLQVKIKIFKSENDITAGFIKHYISTIQSET